MKKKKRTTQKHGNLISEYTIASFIMHMIAEEEAEEEVTDPYEWRFDVRDGSQYNVDPWDYETEAEY